MEHFESLSEACFGGSFGGLFWEAFLKHFRYQNTSSKWNLSGK